MKPLPPLIVHVVFRFGIGGLENGIVNLINRMPQSQWRHAVVALTEVSAEFARRIERPDVRCIALGKKDGHLVREYPRLFRLFRELEPAVVHTRNLAALEAVVPAWAAGVPVRIHGEHGWDMQDPAGKRRRYRHCAGSTVRSSIATSPCRTISRTISSSTSAFRWKGSRRSTTESKRNAFDRRAADGRRLRDVRLANPVCGSLEPWAEWKASRTR